MKARGMSWWLSLVALTAGWVPITAHAAVNGPHVTIEPWGGYANFAKNVNIEDETIWGGTVGLALHRYVSLEGFVGRSSTETIDGFTLYAVPAAPAPAVEPVTMLRIHPVEPIPVETMIPLDDCVSRRSFSLIS